VSFAALLGLALLSFAEDGRTEVDGLVISAIVRPAPEPGLRPIGAMRHELELVATPKTGSAKPLRRLGEPVRLLDANNRTLSIIHPNVDRLEDGRLTARVTLNAGTKSVPALEGSLLVTPAKTTVVTFEGAALKRNASVGFDGGRAKLIVYTLDDDPPDVRFRVTLPIMTLREPPHALATLIDDQGKEIPLARCDGGYQTGGGDAEHRFPFRADLLLTPRSIRALRLELASPVGQTKKVGFRLTDVPVAEAKKPGKANP
jgi:hypothetical protein